MNTLNTKPSEFFRENIARLLKTYPHGIQKKVAKKMEIPQGDLSAYLKGRRNWSEEKCIKLADTMRTTYIDVIRRTFSDETKPLSDNKKSDDKEETNDHVHSKSKMQVISENQTPFRNKGEKLSHADMVGLFKDKGWAFEMNEMLLDLERLDPDQKKLIKAHLAGMVMVLKGQEKKNRH